MRLFASKCAEANIPLILDVSFRFFGHMNDWDMYSILQSHPLLDWVAIEDTGKVWGLSELKVGFMICNSGLRRQLNALNNELRLNVSPFTLNILRSLMLNDGVAGPGHIAELFTAINENRRMLSRIVEDLPCLSIRNTNEKSSVAWMELLCEDCHAEDFCEDLFKAGVVVLPGGPFFWNDPGEGRCFFRIALLRDIRYFQEAMRVFSKTYHQIHTDHID